MTSIKEVLKKIRSEVVKPDEPVIRKASSIGFGSFMAFTPIWGFQMVASLPIAIFFRLNKVLVLIFVNLSVAPLLPLIIYSSFKIGGLFINSSELDFSDWRSFTLETIQINVTQYVIGSIILATIIGIIAFGISYMILPLISNKKIKEKS